MLLMLGGQENDCQHLNNELEKRNVPLSIIILPKLPEISSLYDCKYFFIRPDGVICWRSDVQPSPHEVQRIVSIVFGDCPPHRIPPFHTAKPSSPTISVSFDVALAGGLGGLLYGYTGVGLKAALGVGLGMFSFLRHCRVIALPPAMTESTGQHKAAVIKGFGEAKDVFEVDSR